MHFVAGNCRHLTAHTLSVHGKGSTVKIIKPSLKHQAAGFPQKMIQAIRTLVASSFAHGISKAASTKSTPLRVMWSLLFLASLSLFLERGIKLVIKLSDKKTNKVQHVDQVPFVFPDLYLCPTNPFSGSYPFTLAKSEADVLNAKISQIITQYDKLFYNQKTELGPNEIVYFVQASLPFHLISRYLTQRQEQSILKATVNVKTKFQIYELTWKTFYHPEYLVCFKLFLNDTLKPYMMSKDNSLDVWLSTDPHFPEFNFAGHPINHIVNKANQSISFQDWQGPLEDDVKISGYSLLIVPQGVYPAYWFEKEIRLAPGNAYFLQLKMEENVFNEDLYKTHCIHSHPPVEFTNPLTNSPELFAYSYTACYYKRKNEWLTRNIKCQNSLYPMLWEFNSWPNCMNLSSPTAMQIFSKIGELGGNFEDIETPSHKYCQKKIPCVQRQYSVNYSFGKWPSVRGIINSFFAAHKFHFDERSKPALAKVAQMAQQIQSGNYSTHTMNLFRNYVSESMVRVKISIASEMSSQVEMTWSYSLAEFLPDIGGLLGLCIGCSLLTVCELFEIIFVLVKYLLEKKIVMPAGNEPASGEEGQLPLADSVQVVPLQTTPET